MVFLVANFRCVGNLIYCAKTLCASVPPREDFLFTRRRGGAEKNPLRTMRTLREQKILTQSSQGPQCF